MFSGGNPETGPFYIETAAPGDTLVVHLTRVHLNRDWAFSDDGIVDRALTSDLAVKMKNGGRNVRWHLNRKDGVATPEKPTERLARYSIPLRPMLGCVATAPDFAQAAPSLWTARPCASMTHSSSRQGLPQIGQRGSNCGFGSESTERKSTREPSELSALNSALLGLIFGD